jgi:hypothetical protein
MRAKAKFTRHMEKCSACATRGLCVRGEELFAAITLSADAASPANVSYIDGICGSAVDDNGHDEPESGA